MTSHGDLVELRLDPLERLVRAVSDSGAQRRELTFGYDAQGRRVLKEVRDQAGTVLSRTRYLAGLWEASAEGTVGHVFLDGSCWPVCRHRWVRPR